MSQASSMSSSRARVQQVTFQARNQPVKPARTLQRTVASASNQGRPRNETKSLSARAASVEVAVPSTEAEKDKFPEEQCVVDEDRGRSPVSEVVKSWEESLAAKSFDVVFCASECAPWSKTGGLGDVVGSVPKALAKKGHNVMVVVPRYADYEGAADTGVRKSLWCFGQEHEVSYHHMHQDGVDYVFVGHICFERPGIYAGEGGAYDDNQFRFTLLSLACCEAPLVVPLESRGGEVMGQDVVFVANDWHTSMVPVYIAGKFRPHGVFRGARCCFAIHNLSHQGVEAASTFGGLGLPDEWIAPLEWQFPEWSDQYDEETKGRAINFMKGAILTSDRILTVSEGYAWEITTTEGGWGLDSVIKGREFVLDGIVNGIDYDVWNPAVDTMIARTYTPETLVEGKAACKRALQEELGLPVRDDVPVIGFIGRLDYQKGPDLVKDAIHQICGQDVQMVMLGSGDPEMEQWMREAEGMYPGNFRGWVGFSVPVSHKITAGADILLMPSRFEPCGLNQLYAMQYGTVPVVHAAGGLRDTVKNHEEGSNDSTGFVFEAYGGANTEGLMWALNQALRMYWDDHRTFLAIAKRGMEKDFTWDTSAGRYEQVFEWAKMDPPHCA
uniref:Starch synthase, chloroplastic/amyloplastic n=1 Tax=Tetraselmis sp. GSL018 TaxID=582737 RepID=A0A061R9Z0_9CHLO|mmetsp:Transcript_17208/g.41053  ORF Transcript_17208/g.41053 Transcript_17208/m.41053 type:complete len:612 (-) Transcript_17208:167-2002(-)|eukprot:CAMPEP_0177597008 /NCGR_PEP_ID=MMETSP0419_2-20121207/11461_1 /TAXON_ID=582737 /ORGANISM="Tetraselmis sp., Strain GSL018" /LENGTH=611 /DNA_ID=CAMNT_0019089107 /DNA_START=169 /DNA_END=2004 /DNA_ORIENTATION=+